MSDVQPTGLWGRVAPGTKYPDLNKRLNGLPDWLRTLEEKVGRPLSALTSKAADVMTSGAAGPLIDKLSGTDMYSALSRKAQEESPGMATAGTLAGIAGSAAMGRIPTGMLVAKGAPALAKAAAPAVRSAINLPKAGILGAAGAGAGALEGGIRGGTGDIEGGALKNALLGAGLGGAGGIAGSVGSDALSNLIERLPKRTVKAKLKTADMKQRDAMRLLKQQAGKGAGPGKRADVAEDVARDMADFIRKYKLDVEGNVQQVYKWHKAKWGQLDAAFEAAFPDREASRLIEGLIAPEEFAELANRYTPETMQQVTDKIMKRAAKTRGLASTREMLQTAIDGSFKEADEYAASATRDIAGKMRSRLDDVVAETAKKAGVDLGMPFDEFRHEWGLIQPVAEGASREAIAPLGVAMNSPTMEKQQVRSALERFGGPTIGAAAGSASGAAGMQEGDTPASRALKIGGGALGGVALSKMLGRGATGAFAALDPLAPAIARLAPGAANLGRGAALAGSRAAVGMIPKAVEQVAPQTPEQQQAAETGAAAGQAISSGDTAAYKTQIADKLKERWVGMGMEQWYPGQFDAFIEYARERTGGFEPAKTAHIMYSDPDERKKFLDALQVSQMLAESLPLAEQREQSLLGGAKVGTEEQASSAIAYQKIAEMLRDRALASGGKAGANTAPFLLATIMKDKKLSSAEKRRRVEQLLTQYGGVDFDMMRQAGVA